MFRTHYGVPLGYHKLRLYYPHPRAAGGAYLTDVVLSKAPAGRAPGLGLIMVFALVCHKLGSYYRHPWAALLSGHCFAHLDVVN